VRTIAVLGAGQSLLFSAHKSKDTRSLVDSARQPNKVLEAATGLQLPLMCWGAVGMVV